MIKKILVTVVVLFGFVASLCIAGNCAEIVVKRLDSCTGQTFDRIGNNEAPSDKTFLVAGIEVTNSGYDSFNVDPSLFGVDRNNILYRNSYVTYSLRDIGFQPLDSVTVRAGGSIRGYIAFEIPRGSNENNIEYVGRGDRYIRYECA
jgi:hypothetical protein